MIERHPDRGYTVVHVVPSDWGPFVDIRACYQSIARRRRWHHVITPDEFRARQNDWLWDDPDTVFLCWTLIDPGPKILRKCKVVHVHAEAMDEGTSLMLPEHLAHWNALKTMAVHLDAIAAHTPWASDFVHRHAKVWAFTYPVGWDAEAMGSPRWDSHKHTQLAYHGSPIGRRDMIVPYLKEKLGADFVDITGHFGRALLGRLDTSRYSLYLSHSGVHSFSTWRSWQVASTSAVMVAEVAHDTWPMVGGEHYLPITWFSTEHQCALHELIDILQHDHTEIARRAHEEIARKFTLEYIEDHYLAPAIERMMAS